MLALFLARKLRALDTAGHRTAKSWDTVPEEIAPLSDDAFLYARCAVIMHGRQAYRRVLRDPESIAVYWNPMAERLLELPEMLWSSSSQKPWAKAAPLEWLDAISPATLIDSPYDANDDESCDLIEFLLIGIDPGMLDDPDVAQGEDIVIPAHCFTHSEDYARSVVGNCLAVAGYTPSGRLRVSLTAGRSWQVVATSNPNGSVPRECNLTVPVMTMARWSDEDCDACCVALAAYGALVLLRHSPLARSSVLECLGQLIDRHDTGGLRDALEKSRHRSDRAPQG